MTTVTFETASLADSLRKASRIAPMKGRDFEQNAGLMVEVCNGEEPSILLRATDGGVFYMERVNVLEIEGEDVKWRLPSAVVAGIIGALPIGAGKKCTFRQESGRIRIESGRTRASVGLIDHSTYREWDSFDADQLELVQGFGPKLDQVAWAVDRKTSLTTSSVFLDGENVVATDGQRLATAPLKLPMDEDEILVPMAILAPILSQVVETRAGVLNGYLCLAPNPYTQIKCLLMGVDYPKVGGIMKLQTTDAVLFNRELAAEIIQRIMPVISKERQSDLYVTVGNGEMEFFTEDEAKINSITDSLDLPGQAEHKPLVFRFGPENFISAITKSPGLMVTMNYDPAKEFGPVRFDGRDGYRCWIIPRRQVKNDPQQGDANAD